jgi:hypothetical protein
LAFVDGEGVKLVGRQSNGGERLGPREGEWKKVMRKAVVAKVEQAKAVSNIGKRRGGGGGGGGRERERE